MLRIFILPILVILFSQCVEPPVVFVSEQPEGITPRAYFEPVYRGVFLCESDSATVYVKAKTIHKEKEYAFQVHISEIDNYEGVELIDGQLWIAQLDGPIPVVVDKDSVSGTFILRDTLFHLSEKHVLKYFKGHQILNRKLAEDKWEVLILSIDYDMDLRLSKAILPEDLKALKRITDITDISTGEHKQISLSPTTREFSDILKQHLIFQECDLYKRLKLPTEI